MLRRTLARLVLTVGCVTLASQASAQALPGVGLTSLITSQLGVTKQQADGGIGTLLALAKEKLPAADFGKVTKSIPGADGYLKTAAGLGLLASPLKNLAGATSALGKLGLKPDMVAKFVPILTGFAGQAGGPQVASLLSSVLK